MKKIAAVLCLALVLFVSTAPAVADEQEYNGSSETKVVTDIVLLRPLGIGATAAGMVFFVAGLPFSLITGSVSDTAELLVAKPFRYTFVRKVGDL